MNHHPGICDSGGERAALQTLRAILERLAIAKRLDCGGYSTAFPTSTPAFGFEEAFAQ